MEGERSPWRGLWTLDPDVVFLNHGSFGACPRAVLDAQSRWRERMEREPVRFFVLDLERLLDEARAKLGAFLGADRRDLAFVTNATAGVNAVLRSIELAPGDEVLLTDHVYNACRNACEVAAGRAGARVVVAAVPFPIRSSDEVVEAVLARAGPRTRLALIDHVTSPTGLVLPIARLVAKLRDRGVETMVDGAHAPGMVPVELDAIGAAYYAGNCHKWLCAPKGAGFLHVRRDRQEAIRPHVISHGANSPRIDRSRFLLEFDWMGTIDPTPYLSVPAAIEHLGSLLPGGWPELMARNRALALAGRERLCAALGCDAPAPAEMIGSLASVPIRREDGGAERDPPEARALANAALGYDPLQACLLERHRIQVPCFARPGAAQRIVRISAQLYNVIGEYERLAAALVEALAEEQRDAQAAMAARIR